MTQVFHHTMLRHFSPADLHAALRARPLAFNALLSGNMGLDTLFLMSAFLATLALVPALQKPHDSTLQVRTHAC